MRGHNICFHWEIRKITLNYPQYPLLSGALIWVKTWFGFTCIEDLTGVIIMLISQVWRSLGSTVGKALACWCSSPGPEVIKKISYSTQLSMKFFLLINVKMPTIVGILTLMSGENSILSLSSLKNDELLDIFILNEHLKLDAQLSWA